MHYRPTHIIARESNDAEDQISQRDEIRGPNDQADRPDQQKLHPHAQRPPDDRGRRLDVGGGVVEFLVWSSHWGDAATRRRSLRNLIGEALLELIERCDSLRK